MTPETRRQRPESYGGGHRLLTDALQQFPREMWQFRSAPDGWTIHEVVVHIADSETNSFIRCRRAIAEPGSMVLGYDEVRWVRGLHYFEQSPDDALELFKWLRGNTYRLVRSLPDAAWSGTMVHSDQGVMTLNDWLDVYDRHVPEHINQMRGV
jgi:DinB superfamily